MFDVGIQAVVGGKVVAKVGEIRGWWWILIWRSLGKMVEPIFDDGKGGGCKQYTPEN